MILLQLECKTIFETKISIKEEKNLFFPFLSFVVYTDSLCLLECKHRCNESVRVY